MRRPGAMLLGSFIFGLLFMGGSVLAVDPKGAGTSDKFDKRPRAEEKKEQHDRFQTEKQKLHSRFEEERRALHARFK